MVRRNERDDLQYVLREELCLLEQRGYDATGFRRQLEAIVALPAAASDEAVRQMHALYDQVETDPGPRSPSYLYIEPSDLEGIRLQRPDGPRRLTGSPDPHALADRIAGAWLGRIAGCMLGKPIEGWSFARIRRLCQAAGEWPLKGYVPYVPPPTDEPHWISPDNECLRGNIRCGVRDDDTDYTILGLHILERFGPAFTPNHVAAIWLETLPFCHVYTAERVAYRNIVNYLYPPASARYRNGFREWIGAQIRADAWGYAAPGWPELAAEFAWRDASVSHEGNGIYGEMFFAAAISAALVERELNAVLDAGLAEIPANCRLAEAIRDTRAIAARHQDWESAWHEVAAKYNHYHPVHTINNAVFVILGLLFGAGDFETTITRAVMAGEDVDCTGATAGSVVGAMLGASALPAKWIEPLHDTLLSSVQGFSVVRISDLARRTAAVAQQVLTNATEPKAGPRGSRPQWENPSENSA